MDIHGRTWATVRWNPTVVFETGGEQTKCPCCEAPSRIHCLCLSAIFLSSKCRNHRADIVKILSRMKGSRKLLGLVLGRLLGHTSWGWTELASYQNFGRLECQHECVQTPGILRHVFSNIWHLEFSAWIAFFGPHAAVMVVIGPAPLLRHTADGRPLVRKHRA